MRTYQKVRWSQTVAVFLLSFLSLGLNLYQPYLLSRFIDRVLIKGQHELMLPILSAYLGIVLVSVVLTILQQTVSRYLEINQILDLRGAVLRHLRKIPITEIEKNGTGKYLEFMGNDTSAVASFFVFIFVEFLTLYLQMVAAVVILFFMDWRLGAIALISIPVTLCVPRLLRAPLKTAAENIRTHNQEIGSYLVQSINGSREIRAYGLEEWEQRRNRHMYKGLIRASTFEGLFRHVTGQSGILIISITVTLLYGLGSKQVAIGTITVGMMIASIQYIYTALQPIQAINQLYGHLINSEVAMSRLDKFLNSPVENAAQMETREVPHPIHQEAVVSARNLSVSYDGIPLLKGIDLDIGRGQLAVLVGRSGSGKTTLFRVLLGFMPIESGELYMNGLSHSHWSRPMLAKHIGVVFQENFLFTGTLFENVALGRPGVSEQDVYRALCEVDLKEYVDSLPDGVHTHLDHQGFQLSGGQRQRVAIARACLKKPDILILDEPTSALDRHSEEQVLRSLRKMMWQKTTIISTHRLDTIMAADVIYVMEKGKIIDRGTHEQLMERCKSYAILIMKQHAQEGRIGDEYTSKLAERT
ncbi:ABC transporter ATP-binding protein [Paenibacillus hexagrammi]|uniref:ABC transporter ATP-binding protein/permease n=1 Tax=Paenibacillus hexagrammi TaxID=2908839 RepID=A0ABY3SF52_9BACL|nr:ABC transporter ATP-binding protein [Paenibacillus sp. YPD9-1]UJF31869.1 ABC transporter ATP-binding protein/permease [Paenibacillus sp. YPD9-1]